MADRGLQAYAVPSARAGQQTDPAARRDALSGLTAGGFLVAVIVVVLAIIVAAPQYAKPAPGAGMAADASTEPSLDPDLTQSVVAAAEVPTSKPPGDLKGYRWPVRGGSVHSFYEYSPTGRFEIRGKRVHDGLIITWFEGAVVKAAHKGTVVAAGRDWADHTGYASSLDKVYQRYADPSAAKAKKKGKSRRKPAYPQGIVIDDGNGYYSIYSEIKDLRVKPGDKVKPGQIIGGMSRAEGKQMMRYRLVRMDGPMMRVHESDRQLGYPDYARERVDPLAVLDIDAKKRPKRAEKGPKDPPRLSEY